MDATNYAETALTRTEALLTRDGVRRLQQARVAVFGLGGVGGHAVDALARSGIGALDLIDADKITLTNLNRQMFALHSTLGMYKTDAAAQRIRDIAPDCRVRCFPLFFGADTADSFDFSAYDYVIDAIDSVASKLLLIRRAYAVGTPIISCMGMGNKLDPCAISVTHIEKTSVCPLARVIRRELRQSGIRRLPVVCSTETPRPGAAPHAPASYACVPAAAGLVLASHVIRCLCAPSLSSDQD